MSRLTRTIDDYPPTIPTGLAVSIVSTTQLDLSWSAASDVSGILYYEVERNGVLQSPVFGTSMSYTGLSQIPYTFRVRARDTALNLGAYSGTVVATPADLIAPSIPLGVVAVSNSSSTINLSWNAATDSGGAGLSGYEILKDGTTILSVGNVLAYQDAGLVPSSSHTYQVRSKDAANNVSAYSAQVSATTGAAPPVPTQSLIRFTPGVYMWLNQGSGGGGLSGWVAQINSLANESSVVGAAVQLDWADIETNTRGVYTWTVIDTLRNACAAINKRLMILQKFQYFNGTPVSPAGRIPTYLNTIQGGAPGYTAWDGVNPASPPGNLALVLNLWDSRVMTPYIQAGQAAAARYKDDPVIELWGTGETSVANLPGSNYNTVDWLDGLVDYGGAMRLAWPNTAIRICTNYIGDTGTDAEMRALMAFMHANQLTGGGPDNFSRTYQSNPVYTGVSGGIDYRGLMAWCSESQYPASSSGGPSAGDTDATTSPVPSTANIYAHQFSGSLAAGGSTMPHYMLFLNNSYTGNPPTTGTYHTWLGETLPYIRSVSGRVNTNNPYTNNMLATDHYVQAKVVPRITHPRPDAETLSWERCRLAPAGIEWRIPIVVRGGAWPFIYVFVAGPPGMTLGRNYGDADYGVLKWPSPTIGTHSIKVKVRTQDYARTAGSADSVGEHTISFTLVVAAITDATKFVCLDAVSGNDGNAGAFATPRKTLSGFNGLSTAGKQLILRGGTYAMNALSALLSLDSKAKVWIGYPGETPIVDYSGVWSGASCYIGFGGPGCFATNIRFSGSPPSMNGANDYHHIVSNGNRNCFFECTFTGLNGLGVNPGNFSNWSGIAMFTNLAMHSDVSAVKCTFSNFSRLVNGGACVWYHARYGVIEGCTITGFNNPANVQQGFILKGHCAQNTIRNNYIPAQSFGTSPIVQHQGIDGDNDDVSDQPNFNETCWNYGFQTPPGHNGSTGTAHTYGAGTYAPWTGYCYRNTFVGAFWVSSNGLACTMHLNSNVLLTEAGVVNDATTYGSGPTAGLTLSQSNNVIGSFANRASFVDSAGLLLSAYLSSNGLTRGTRGHEVA